MKVSVIIPVYNVAKYLRECLDSVVNQTLNDIEIICVDDGSTDGSSDILRQYAERDARIKIFQQANSGAAVARNLGLRHASGEYLHFMDSDDICHRSMLKDMYAVGRKQFADIVICGFDRVNHDATKTLSRVGVPRQLLTLARRGFCSGREMSAIAFSARTTEYCCTRIFRRAFVGEHGLEFQDLKRNNDLYFARMSLALADRISFCDKRFYKYRRGISSISAKAENAHCFCSACSYLRQRLEAVGLFETFARTFFRLVVQVFLSNLNSCKDAQSYREYYSKARPLVLGLLAEIGSDGSNRVLSRRERVAYDSLVSDESPVALLFALREADRREPSVGECVKTIVKRMLKTVCR